MIFTESIHCRARVHCWTCRNSPAWQVRVGGKIFECPYGITKDTIPAALIPENPMDQLGPAIWKRWHDGANAGLLTLQEVTEKMWREVPCGTCKQHFLEARAAIPFRPNDQRQWMIDLHNYINVKLGKPVWKENTLT